MKYISGFVVKKLTRDKKMCETCASFLISTNNTSHLITLKNRGKLTIPSEDVIKVTNECEKIIRQNNHLIFVKKNIKDFLALKVFNAVINYSFTHDAMFEHIRNQDIFDNHKIQLVKYIIEIYVKIRLYHEAKFSGEVEKKQYIRHKYSKLIHFYHQ